MNRTILIAQVMLGAALFACESGGNDGGLANLNGDDAGIRGHGPTDCGPGTVVCQGVCMAEAWAASYCGGQRDAGVDAGPGPDTKNDALNCGQVGHVCKDNELCAAGTCVADTLDKLAFDVVEAKYSRALDRIVVVSRSPAALHIYDPAVHTDAVVALPVAPSAVSVTPDGHQAVVGHDGFLSHVDLDARAVRNTFPVSAAVGKVIAAGNGKAYAFPSKDPSSSVHTIDLASGHDDPVRVLMDGAVPALHPNGQWIYAVHPNGFEDIDKLDITKGTPTMLTQNYVYSYDLCDNLWISRDGSRIFTACGTVLNASSDKAADMSYASSLGKEMRIASVDDTTTRVAALVGPYYAYATTNDEIRFYEAHYLAQTDTKALPPFRMGTTTVRSKGQFVFFRADGSAVYAIVQANPATSSASAVLPAAIATF